MHSNPLHAYYIHITISSSKRLVFLGITVYHKFKEVIKQFRSVLYTLSMHLILTICSFVQHIIAGKYAGLPTNELRTKLPIDLLDFHSFLWRLVAENNSATLDDNLLMFSMTFLAILQFWKHVLNPFSKQNNVSKLRLGRHLVLHKIEAICCYQFPGRDLPLQKSIGRPIWSPYICVRITARFIPHNSTQAYQLKKHRTQKQN